MSHLNRHHHIQTRTFITVGPIGGTGYGLYPISAYFSGGFVDFVCGGGAVSLMGPFSAAWALIRSLMDVTAHWVPSGAYAMPLTRQQIVDIVFPLLVEQGQRSVDGKNKQCLYRSADGCKCAVGHLIPDDLYDPEMEGTVIMFLPIEFPVLADIFNKDDTDFLQQFQNCHDRAGVNGTGFVPEFSQALESLCKIYDLRFPGT